MWVHAGLELIACQDIVFYEVLSFKILNVCEGCLTMYSAMYTGGLEFHLYKGRASFILQRALP